MTPRRFRWHRFAAVMRYDPTGTVEIVVGLCFMVVPGCFLVVGGSEFPGQTVLYFSSLGLTEIRIGLWMVALGLLQVWGAGTNWYAMRAWIATILAGSLTAVTVAFRVSGYGMRWAAPLMVGTILAQMYVAWRCWHERPDPLSRPQARQPGGTRADVTVQ